ncbi:hypothetical protein GCM10010191_88740 [Actinomadura vinacea]|uniref:Tyr recombinase domain-containing protein n=1 Tax=Actinomadura vinacea TaxID=115336 RepID=A0ABP5XNV2_9ACTN
MTSENPVPGGSQTPEFTSENTDEGGSTLKRRGARPTPLPATYAEILEDDAAALHDVPLSPDVRRTYLSRVRMYLAWLASGDSRRRFREDPLTNPRSRDWAIRDYRAYLLREADPRAQRPLRQQRPRRPRRLLCVARHGQDQHQSRGHPQNGPKAMDSNAQIRWLRAVEDWPHARDRALALLPFYAGLRTGDAVALGVSDVRMSAREGALVVYGKGGKVREVPIHAQLRGPADCLAR